MQNQQSDTPLQETQPLVSFILTYYNVPVEMLCCCIDSIRALSLSPSEREIILIDDGSEVSPVNELIKYEDDIIYVRQKNKGVSVARNEGMKIAKGKYLQFVDSDDYLLKAPYEHCLDIIRSHPDTDVVLFDFTKGQPKTRTNYDTSPQTNGVDFMRNQNLQGAVWCCLFRQGVRGKLEFTPGICYGEDEEFTPQLLLRAETVYHTTAQAYFYRERNTSAVHQTDLERIHKRLDDTHKVITHLQYIADRLPQHDRLALQRRVAQLTMDHIYNTIVLTHSAKTLEQLITDLHTEGLFPLPDYPYSPKYTWFRRMTQTAIGRKLLLHTLPLLNKER